jgi:hypothetical protein
MKIEYEYPEEGEPLPDRIVVHEGVKKVPRVGDSIHFSGWERFRYRVHKVVQYRDVLGRLESVLVVLR